MHPKRRQDVIIHGKFALAVRDYLDGDPLQNPAQYLLSRSMFDAWADSVELPYGRVSRKKDATDGIYVLQDCEGWMVIEQKSGILLPKKRKFSTYKQAKREALAWEILGALRNA